MAIVRTHDRERDRAEACARVGFTQRDVEKLTIYEKLLVKWQTVENLVAPSTFAHLWTRHFADSAQLREIAPDARRWVDLGSGAGLPGMVLAILLADQPDSQIHLIESNARKCAFLREVSRETSAPVIVHHGRIENIVSTLAAASIQAVTARAVASLATLLDYAAPLLKTGAIGLFLKGQSVEAELTDLRRSDSLKLRFVTSKTDRTGRVVVVELVPTPASPNHRGVSCAP